ncbi:MAG: hypothetical protein WA635_06765 [Gallionella sp.]
MRHPSFHARRGRGKSQKSKELIAVARTILEEIQPATVRAVCYQLFIRKLIPSMDKKHTNAVGTQLVWARENSLLDWSWIVDETREGETIPSWSNPEGIIRAAVQQYRKNYWEDQRNRVEVWSEKGTIRGTLAPILNEYGVIFRVMHGYGSATALHEIATETMSNEKPLTVLYVGDWDPSGMQMSEVDLPRRLKRYCGVARIVRVALEASDVGANSQLPPFEALSKSKDPRYKWFVDNFGHRCWELDALSRIVLRERVEAQILMLIDLSVWERAKDVEAAEMNSMQGIMANWKTISLQASKYSPGVHREPPTLSVGLNRPTE